MKINLNKLYFKLLLLFPITTLFQVYFDFANKLLFSFIIILQLFLSFKDISLKKIIEIIFVVSIFIFNYTITDGSIYNTNELFYLPFCILYLSFFYDNKSKFNNFIKTNKRYINFILLLWNIIVFISIFISSSWNSTWTDGFYFGSFCGSVFRLAPTALLIGSISLCCMNIHNNKKYFYYLFLPLFCFLMGGSRTYMFVGLLLFILGWYYYTNSKKIFYLTIIPVSLILMFFVFNSAMMSKFNATSYSKNSYFDYLGTISNGRSVFWEADIISFSKANLMNKFFGNGFNYVYDINYKAFGGLVWAHNDFIQILLSHGLLMLILYISKIKNSFKLVNKKIKAPYFIVFVIWLFNAIFNMYYTYFCAMISLPFLIISIKSNSKITNNKEINNEKVTI